MERSARSSELRHRSDAGGLVDHAPARMPLKEGSQQKLALDEAVSFSNE